MEAEAAKLIGAGLATSGMIGAGIGLGNLFGQYLQAAIRNPSAAASQQTMLFLGMALTETMGLFAFVISFDLFNMSLLLKGIGMTTLPLQLFDYLRWDFDPTAAAVSTVSILLTLAVVVWVDRSVGLRSLRFG